jgi:pantothenate kinase-related protein Tda10
VALGVETLRALKSLNNGDGGVGGGGGDGVEGVAVQRYDKTLRGGRGDRAPASTWPTVCAPLDVILLEVRGLKGGEGGWFLARVGFFPDARTLHDFTTFPNQHILTTRRSG